MANLDSVWASEFLRHPARRSLAMRKYLAICVVCTFLVFALALMAQTGASGQTGNMPSGTNSSQNPNASAGSMSTSQGSGDQSGSWSPSSGTSGQTGTSSSASQSPSYGSSSQTGAYGSQTSGMGSSTMAGTALEGCIVRQATDYFLIPKSGNPVHLTASGSTDLSAHLGHRVKVHGSESPMSSSTGSSSANTAGMTGSATGQAGTSQESQSSSGSISSGAGTSSKPESSTGTTSSMGAAGQPDLRSAATQDMTVTRIDMVSESCPTNWNTKWNNTAAGAAPSSK
jgi:hypothetical protein